MPGSDHGAIFSWSSRYELFVGFPVQDFESHGPEPKADHPARQQDSCFHGPLFSQDSGGHLFF